MSADAFTPADEKALALYYAQTALLKTLKESGHLDMDHLFKNLAGATRQLESIGETGAASFLGSVAQNWTAI